jgi:hypothetical protein
MALSLASISKGKARKAPRIVLLGVEKVGKSTFAGQSENPIFIPMKGEEGTDEIDCAKFPVSRSYGDVIDALGVLYREDHPYQTAIIDSSSALEPLIWDHTAKTKGADSIETVNGGFGKGYVEALKFWREIMDGLDALREDRGMASILIGHVKAKEFNDPEADPYTTYMFDIQERAANALYRWSDAILFANFKRAAVTKNDVGFNKKVARGVGTGERRLFTEKRPAHPGGNRYSLPYELPLAWEAFAAAMAKSSGPAEPAAVPAARAAEPQLAAV